MESAKRTYALPAATLELFEQAIAAGKRSAKVAELIDNWIRERERETLRLDVIEGCRKMWDVYQDTALNWEVADSEADRALER